MRNKSSQSHRVNTSGPAWANEFEAILKAYAQSGGEPAALKTSKAAVLVMSANRVLVSNEIPGVGFEAEELPNGVRAHIKVEPGTQIDKPVHLCFGMVPEEGEQQIIYFIDNSVILNHICQLQVIDNFF